MTPSTEWCSWMAGLFDGEATFVIEPNGTPRLRITLREDDRAVLEHIQSELGFGSLYTSSAQKARDRGGKDRDSVVLCVSGRKNCSVLIDCLRGRMRSKKAEEFDTWAEAINVSNSLGAGNHPDRRKLMLPYREHLLRLRRR